VHWAFVGNLEKPFALLLVEIARQRDGTIDTIEHTFFGLAVFAIDGMDSGVRKPYRDPIERQRLAFRVKAQCHRRAGAKAGEHEIIGTKTAVKAANFDRLVGNKPVPAYRDFLLEASVPGFSHNDFCIVWHVGRMFDYVKIALRPGADHIADIGGVAASTQEVVGSIK